jgi:GNAT superfamily N-acetyltransferase
VSAVDPLAHWPDRTALTDASGRTLLAYTLAEGTRSGRPWADGVWRPDDVSVEDAVAGSLSGLPGFAVSTSDPALVTGWLAGGASTLRHAHTMTHDLSSVPEPPRLDASVRVHAIGADQIARHAHRLGELNFAAYPPEHPDHAHASVADAVREMEAVSRGEVLGPVLPVSQVAVADRTIIGAALIVDRPGAAPEGGPWVLDIFRDSSAPQRGVGRALLVAVLHAAGKRGLASVSLVVSHANANAFALYDSLGFIDHEQSWTLALPDQRKNR